MHDHSCPTEQPQQRITSLQRILLQHKLTAHKVQIEAFLKVLQHQDREIYTHQIEGVMTAISDTLDIILNP